MSDVSPWDNPDLSIAMALMVGLFCQVAAVHLRVPGIVLLLGAGVLLGPDVLDVIRPHALGGGMSSLVGFAVAVILFEGGLAMDLPRIRRSGRAIQRLLFVGPLITAIGAGLVVHWLMGWDWMLASLFGTLVIVTGPTVVTPLLKRLKVERKTSTILEAEGVLIDPIGAIIAFVMLEIVLWANGADSGLAPHLGFGSLFARLALGTAIGVVGGMFLSRALKVRGLIPEGLGNVLTLTVVLALYQVSETVWHESGIAAVTAAGVVVRMLGTPVEREMIEFKEQLTVMLIGMLFVLLAADVRMNDVISLGAPGVLTAIALIVIVRPLNVLVSTAGTSLTWQQRAFVSWIGPRGIVAAAVASLFAVELEHAHIEGGAELRALVFLVIATTVVISGLSGGFVADALGLRRPSNTGWVILGAHQLAREVGRQMMAMGQDVLLVDANPDNCHEAEEEGFDVRHGNGLKDTTLGRLALDTRTGVIGITANEEVNFLFAQKAKQRERVPRAYVALRHADSGVTPGMVHELHAQVLFGVAIDMARWENAIENGKAVVQRWRMLRSVNDDATLATAAELHEDHQLLPLVVRRGDQIVPASDTQTYRSGDEVVMVVHKRDLNLHDHRMRVGGWEPMPHGETV